MRSMMRPVVAVVIVMAVVMAWWFPAPLLIRGELADWGKLYEARYRPPEFALGATAAAQALIQSVTAPVPLTEFISAETTGQTIVAADPAWAGVFADLEARFARDPSEACYVAPSVAPFSALDEAHRYVRWQDARGIRHMAYRFLTAKDFAAQRIPPEARFPLRSHWVTLLTLGTFALVFGFVRSPRAGTVETSSAGAGFRWSVVLAAPFAGMILWPFVYRTVGTGVSFASIVMGGLFFLGALAGMWLFGRQAALLQRMLAGACLAHFTYQRDEWERYVEWNFGEEASQKKSLWLMISVISLVVGLGFVALMRDAASVWVFCFLMGLMAFLWILAVALPRLKYRRNLRRCGEAYISKDGVYVGGSVHSWNMWGSRLESVEFDARPLPHLRFLYSYLMVAGRSLYFFRNYVTVRVPVPAGQASAAHRVVRGMSP